MSTSLRIRRGCDAVPSRCPHSSPSPKRSQRAVGKVTVWILGDQLSPRIASLQGLAPDECVVLMIESIERSRQLPYHKQKLALLWSAMRHFAGELRGRGYVVDYHEASPDFAGALRAHARRYRPARVRLLETAEYGATAPLVAAARQAGLEVDVIPNNLFISDRAEFAREAEGKKTLLLESFYRRMRRKTGLLIVDGKPAGGAWNYDRENRERPPKGHVFPEIPRYAPDETTRAVMQLVSKRFPRHFGEIEDFAWPVTRADAERFLEDFLDRRLDLFGPYEDAIVLGERALYHSLLSPLINIGLLDPLDVCRRAEGRYFDGRARLNSVEGFIRQIIGWREFVYQVYHLKMPTYRESNFFEADLPLPDFYWSAETRMLCVRDAISSLRRWGINHHIQRLMVTGNFALIAGIDPQAVNDWYWLAYADAYDWVVTPNVLGLALFADGGIVATKPYAASANYLNKMGDCCASCTYDPRDAEGERACPFNALYWDFLVRNRRRFAKNPRMRLVLTVLEKRGAAGLRAILARAARIRDGLRRGEPL